MSTKNNSVEMIEQKRFELFTKELAVLSKKYGVAIQSIGGVTFDLIKEIKYTSDSTSGDLEYSATFY